MTESITALLAHDRVRTARAHIESSDETTLGRQAALSAIPAPTGAEAARGARVAEMLGDVGLQDVRVDDVGNVRGWYRNVSSDGCVVISAHLDTVFGPELDVSVARRERRGARPGGGGNAATDPVRRHRGRGGFRRSPWGPAFVRPVRPSYRPTGRVYRPGRRRHRADRASRVGRSTLPRHLSRPRRAFVGGVRRRESCARGGAGGRTHRRDFRAQLTAHRALGRAPRWGHESQLDPPNSLVRPRPAQRGAPRARAT